MRAGQDPARFLDYSLREMTVIVLAAADRDAELAHAQAVMTSFAYHAPDKMPKPGAPGAARGKSGDIPNAETDAIYARAALKAWAARSQGRA